MNKLLIILIALGISIESTGQCIGTAGQVSWHFWYSDVPYWGLEHVLKDDTYPNGPDRIRTLNATATSLNYDERFSSMIKGFIIPTQSGSYKFNVTGDNLATFYLSDDSNYVDYSDTTAYSSGWSGVTDHNNHDGQTSEYRTLVAGQHYYFELHHFEEEGGDHAMLYWDIPGGSNEDWQIISSPYLADICDPICQPKGTPCDDGNGNTVDDIYDGSCNCVGSPNTGVPSEFGERGVLNAYIYYGISNSSLSDLYDNPSYPVSPSGLVMHNQGLYASWPNDLHETGVLIKGYLLAPTTGSYDFNVTGVGETTFRLSNTSDTDINHEIFSNRWWMGVYEHEAETIQGGEQSLSNISLQAGDVYYFELIQKNPGYGNRFMIFWNGPQHAVEGWYRIPSILLYNYNDPILCVPEFNDCDDGNPLTIDDMMNGDCNCIGTICAGGSDCDNSADDFTKEDYCETTDQLGTKSTDSWLSCTARPSAVPEFSLSNFHWIQYDLGNEYLLGQTHIWNYNVADETDHGFENVAVHYSLDGLSWDELGEYNWILAPGDTSYRGFSGPDFGNLPIRYVLITSLDPANDCRGISKITFNASFCEEMGTTCDDGDVATLSDHFDDMCQCVGYTAEELDCSLDTLFVNESDLSPNQYHAIMALMSEGKVMNSTSVNYNAGIEIVLDAGFEVSSGSSFEANIEDCPPPSMALIESKSETEFLKRKVRPDESLQVFNLEGSDIQTIRIYIPQATNVSLNLYDHAGDLITPIMNHYYQDYGDHYKRLYLRKLDPGIYTVKMDTPNGSYVDKLTILDSI